MFGRAVEEGVDALGDAPTARSAYPPPRVRRDAGHPEPVGVGVPADVQRVAAPRRLVTVDHDVRCCQDVAATVADQTLVTFAMNHAGDVVTTPHLQVGDGIE